MLEKPAHGWTIVRIGENEIGAASYLDDVPLMCLDAFITYLGPANSRGQHWHFLPFGLTFDAEGYHFGLAEFDDTLYVVHNASESGSLVTEEVNAEELMLDRSAYAADVVRALAKECAEDISRYMEDWVMWEPAMDDDTPQEEIAHRRALLSSKVESLRLLLAIQPGC